MISCLLSVAMGGCVLDSTVMSRGEERSGKAAPHCAHLASRGWWSRQASKWTESWEAAVLSGSSQGVHVACCMLQLRRMPGGGCVPLPLCGFPIPSHPSAARSRGLAQCFMSVRAASSGRTALTPYERELLPSLRTVRACAVTAVSLSQRGRRLGCPASSKQHARRAVHMMQYMRTCRRLHLVEPYRRETGARNSPVTLLHPSARARD